jgi:hypothetical protein
MIHAMGTPTVRHMISARPEYRNEFTMNFGVSMLTCRKNSMV